MKINVFLTLTTIAAAGVCTFLTRLIPFVLFGGRKEVPPFISYLGKILPPAIIATLIIYCLKNINLTQLPGGLPEFLSIILVVILHRWKRNNLLSIGAGTIFYMILVQFVF